jgi:hypothetical protein
LKVLILTSCTGEKAVDHPDQLTLEDFQKGSVHLGRRELGLQSLLRTAGELYTGEQHLRLMRGVGAFRSAAGGNCGEIELHVLSAGYGIIPEGRKVAPYEVTFATMKSKQIRDWADALGVPGDFRRTVVGKYDLGLILLGDNYLQACAVDASIEFGGPTLLFCGTITANKLAAMKNVRVVPVSNPEAKRFSCGLVGLKGELATRVLKGVAESPEILKRLLDPKFDVLKWLESVGTTKASKPKTASAKPLTQKAPKERSMVTSEEERQRFTFFIPRQKSGMKYFIPEWDDRVDPDYDFLNDGITADRDPYVHDVYSHEIYQSPNYDGILVSKSVIEDNKTKKERIRNIGIHRHVRVPRNFPLMGDCGAFNYIDDEVPPYETNETLEFYETLDFDYGVSIDHLIIPAHLKRTIHVILSPEGREKRITASQFAEFKESGMPVARGRAYPRDLFETREFLGSYEEEDLTEGKRRWALTLDNAKDFISQHKKKGLKFTPIAGCQGYSIDSQIEMFKEQQSMGYKYIALGGLVRSKTTEILDLLEAVNKVRKPGVKIHLFGVARPEAIPAFVQAGVDSVDSARFLRQAWLSATSNYYAGDVDRFVQTLKPKVDGNAEEDEVDEKWRYAAVRVPPLVREGENRGGKITLTNKAKKLADKGWTLQKLQKEEHKSLTALRAFDQGKLGIDETLKIVLAYDQLMGGDPRNTPHYRRVLEDKPWRSCPCPVCKSTGIDVVIFRRNNRNRRRGFHNTWWFYQLFSRLTAVSSE